MLLFKQLKKLSIKIYSTKQKDIYNNKYKYNQNVIGDKMIGKLTYMLQYYKYGITRYY